MQFGLIVDTGRESPRPFTIEFDGGVAVGELLAELARQVGLPASPPPIARVARTATMLDDRMTLAESDLRHGDLVLLGPAAAHAVPTPSATAGPSLLVVGGPGAGRRFPLRDGEYTIGRDAGAEIRLEDDDVSRRHARLDVEGTRVRLTDVGSTNGSFVEAHPVESTVEIGPDDLVEVGNTLLALDGPTATIATAATQPTVGGFVRFNRPPRVSTPLAAATFTLPQAPTRPEKARLPMAASVVPIVMGLVMFALLRNPSFLLFMALGPVMAAFSVVDNRRTGRSTFRRQQREFEVALDQLGTELETSHRRAVLARRRAHPDLARVALRAQTVSPDLWERRPSDDDFLVLRVGTADRPTMLEIDRPTGGEPRLIEAAEQLRGRFTTDPLVPVTLDLPRLGVVGIAGPAAAAGRVARAIVLQAATLHSHRDLAIVAMTSRDAMARWSWVAWLPHAETLAGPDSPPTIVDDAGAAAMTARLASLIDRRRAAARSPLDHPRHSPFVLVVLDGPTGVEGATMSRLLAEAPGLDIAAVAIAETPEQLPGECAAIVAVGDKPSLVRVTMAATGEQIEAVVADAPARATALEVARALAGVRDAGAGDPSAELPSHIGLVELLGLDVGDDQALARRWAEPGPLAATLGVSRAGRCVVDLRADGPHALVAGTTGSGKSELLRSLVASLAMANPPERLAFVLIDYKGGAAFRECAQLPHTVGFFSDLDAHLATRALVSLNAELRRREEVLRGAGAKDLIEMEGRDPAHTPPNLVIVVDEFAFLRNEVPEFMSGIVDIAQRGRSLGIHLVLATQRPSGVVDEHIRANTDLRIALRVNDDHDSNDIIGRAVAAQLPRSVPGRAYVRTGHRDLLEIQTGFAGGPAQPLHRAAADGVRVGPFPRVATVATTTREVPAVTTELQELVGMARRAAEQTGRKPSPSPWLPPLLECYPLDGLDGLEPHDVGGEPAPGIAVGLLDEPNRQAQRPWVLDLAATGNLLIYGTTGTGKSTALRTIAAALAGIHPPAEATLLGLDFSSGGLRAIEALPHCAGVVSGRDAEMVDRLVAAVDRELTLRRRILESTGAGSLGEVRIGASTGADLPPELIVIIDDLGGLISTYETIDHGELIERLGRMVADGPALGVHFVITASRRSGLPASITGQVSQTLVMRLADDDEYSWLGVAELMKGRRLPAGRGVVSPGIEVQLAVVGDDPSGEGQARALAERGRRLSERWAPVGRIEAAPTDVIAVDLPPDGDLVVIGIDALTSEPVTFDLADLSTFLVAGPDRSGRSTALAALARGAAIRWPNASRHLVAPRRSPLVELAGWESIIRQADDAAAIDVLAARLEHQLPGSHPIVVVVDDGDELIDGPVALALDRLVRRGRDGGLVLLVAAQAHVLHRTFAGWLTEARKAKAGIVLEPDVAVDGDLFGVRFPRRGARTFPPGRGYLVVRGAVTFVQVAR